MGKFDEARECYDKATLLNPSLDIPLKRTNSPEEENKVFVPEDVKEDTQYIQKNMQEKVDESKYLSNTSAEETGPKTLEGAEEVVTLTPLRKKDLYSAI